MGRFGRASGYSVTNYLSRAPEHYTKFLQQLKKPSTRVHDKAVTGQFLDLKWDDKTKRVERVPDVPIPVKYPKEADQGLWGGEGIVKGYIKPRKYLQAGWPRPKYWFPELKKVVLFSEILDKHFTLIVTQRTLDLVDQHQGLDSYILRTPVQDLKSQLGLLLRRKMLLNLVREDFKTPEIAKEMKEKYGDCIIPEEEAEWFGLSRIQASTKIKIEDAKNNVKIPLKYQFAEKLIADLEYKMNNPDPEPESGPEKKGVFSKIRSSIGL